MDATQQERALTAFAYILTHPSEWRQQDWRCKTGMCFAGIVAFAEESVQPLLTDKDWQEYSELAYRWRTADPTPLSEAESKRYWALRVFYDLLVATDADDLGNVDSVTYHGETSLVTTIANRAIRLLGIGDEDDFDEDGTVKLFDGANSLNTLRMHLARKLDVTEEAVQEQAQAIAAQKGWAA